MTVRPPPPGSAFTMSPEELVDRARGWDVGTESKVETQRLLDKLAEYLAKERSQRAASAIIIADLNAAYGRLEEERRIDHATIEALRESNHELVDERASPLYRTVRAVDQHLLALWRNLRERWSR